MEVGGFLQNTGGVLKLQPGPCNLLHTVLIKAVAPLYNQ
jgi:hypothetical protein